MDPEDIVRSLAASQSMDADGFCLICSGFDANGSEHDPDCPWRLAREWVSEHPERGERGYLRWYNDDGSPVEMGEFTKVTFNPPFNPQYDLIGDAEQPQDPADGS